MEEIKTLSTIEHILKRSGMYIGSTVPTDHEIYVFENGKIDLKKINYTDGLLKICNEVIDNSIDCGIKTNWEYSTRININITNDTFTCEDNGPGIPVVKNKDDKWIPVIATCVPLSGSNFSDEERKSIGTNGIGVKATNIFSTYFECISNDGKNKIKIICKNNLSEEKHTLLKGNDKTGVKITFKPDFTRFGVKEFRPELISVIETRLKMLSWFFPKCNITLNSEKLNIKAKDLSSLFPQPTVVYNSPNVYICTYPSEEPKVFSYVNGIYLSRGGNHVDYILGKIIEGIREKVSRKYKSIKPADIRNRLGIVIFFNNFSNCVFDSQTKETLTNSLSDISNFLKENKVDLDSYISKILKEKVIVDNITDLFKLKEELAEKKELAKLNKTKKEVDSEKYFPPIGKTQKKYLMITEGFSAFSGISPILGRKGIGYYMLKGKIVNVIDLKPIKFMNNQEINELVNILGIDLSNPDTDMNYEKVVILTDADADGSAIAGLVITLFSKIAPKMLKDGRICRLETPLLIGSKNGKVEEYYFSFPNKNKLKKNLEYFYLKGLGSWTKKNFDQILEKEGGIEGLIHPYETDKNYKESIENWFGKDTEPRKEAFRGKEFHIDGV